MKIHYECIACTVNQGQRIVEMSTGDLAERKRAMLFLAKKLGEYFTEDSVPATDGGELFLELYKFLGNDDPFKRYKEVSNTLARAVTERIGYLDDFKKALKLAIAGNLIDFAVGYTPGQMEEELLTMAEEDLYLDESEDLYIELERAKTLLYIVDNCGEIYFDRLLLELISKTFPALDIYIAGREGPIINDATVEDLLEAGFGEIGKVLSTGSRLPGAPLGSASEEFRRAFERANVIIAKGQANFETLSDLNDPRIFFLLKAKCAPISRELGVPRGAMVCKRGGK